MLLHRAGLPYPYRYLHSEQREAQLIPSSGLPCLFIRSCSRLQAIPAPRHARNADRRSHRMALGSLQAVSCCFSEVVADPAAGVLLDRRIGTESESENGAMAVAADDRAGGDGVERQEVSPR